MAKKKHEDSIDLGTAEYEDYIRQPLKIMRIFFAIYTICAFLIPVYNGSSIGMDTPVTFVCWIVMLLGCFSCHGRLFDFLPLPFIAGIRTIHICFYVFIKHVSFNILTTVILLVVELSLNMLYVSDKNTYTYIKEEEKRNEYY